MEYKETRNIFVDISKITIEHVLPQSLSKEWIEYLDGEEEAADAGRGAGAVRGEPLRGTDFREIRQFR